MKKSLLICLIILNIREVQAAALVFKSAICAVMPVYTITYIKKTIDRNVPLLFNNGIKKAATLSTPPFKTGIKMAGFNKHNHINITSYSIPTITYPTTLFTYTREIAITPLTPINTGVPIPTAIYGLVSPLAGSTTAGNANGTGAAASFNHPIAVANDGSTSYIIESGSNKIRQVTHDGIVTDFVGSNTAGATNGKPAVATFNSPTGMTTNGIADIYIADSGNNLIRKFTLGGSVTTFAGSGAKGLENGVGTAAKFNNPRSVVFQKIGSLLDGPGNLYVADYGNNVIRKIAPDGTVTTFAGSGARGSANGTGTAATFSAINGLTVDPSGNLYVVDGKNMIRKITPAGVVTTFAGNIVAGAADGTGTAASFNNITSLIADRLFLYVADAGNNLIRKITFTGVVSTLCGSITAGAVNGAGGEARFRRPYGLSYTYDYYGYPTLIVADYGNNMIRKVTLGGYEISPALPFGLNFDGTTGIISGAPLVNSPATKYTIRAYNVGKIYTSVVNIAVISPKKAPRISYPYTLVTPLSYPKGVVIPPVHPVNGGGAIPAVVFGNTSTFAGSGISGTFDGADTAAQFNRPYATAVDMAGNVYVADGPNNMIRKITPSGMVSTLAGRREKGAANGTGTAATFNLPTGLTVDKSGNVYVADQGNNLIRKITPDGVVSTFAGTGVQGSANGAAASATFNKPYSVVIDTTSGAPWSGNLYVSDYGNNMIRKITNTGIVSTLVSYNTPLGMAIDKYGDILVASYSDNLVNSISPEGQLRAFPTDPFKHPYAIAINKGGDVFVADGGNNRIWMGPAYYSASGHNVAGGGPAGAMNGVGEKASFNLPVGLSIDASGNLYVADYGNNLIRKIQTHGYYIFPALPDGLNFESSTGIVWGKPMVTSPSTFYDILGYNEIGISQSYVYLGVTEPIAAPDISYFTSRKYTKGETIKPIGPGNNGGAVPAKFYGQVSTLAGGGFSFNGAGPTASFNGMGPMVTDPEGNIYVAEFGVESLTYGDNMIRKINYTGHVSTFAGGGYGGNPSKDGIGVKAFLDGPDGIGIDLYGNLYVSDYNGNRIRKITPGALVTSYAGSGSYTVKDNSGIEAGIPSPAGIAVDDQGTLYVAESSNHVIRKITTAGVVSSMAGGGLRAGFADGTGAEAKFNYPQGVTIDKAGNLYVADFGNHRIRKITPDSVVSTFAGNGTAASVDGTGTAASFNFPAQLTADNQGNIYVADRSYRVRMINPAGVVTTIAGDTTAGFVDSIGTAAKFGGLNGMATDIYGNLYVTDSGNGRIRKVLLTGYSISPALPPGLSFSNKGIISGTPTQANPPTNYTITAYNTSGSSKAVINIEVQQGSLVAANSLAEEAAIGEPIVKQLISPNGDGNNDILSIDNIQYYPDNKIMIMNAAGAKVYETSGYGSNGKVFDGHSNITGKLQTSGTYFYQLEYQSTTGTTRKTGYFVIKY